MLRPGDVVRIHDAAVSPPKAKRHICVCPERRLFLRINSAPFWPPHHRLRLPANSGLIDVESYVELRQLCRFSTREVEAALRRTGNLLGRMSTAEARALAWAVQRAVTLAEEHQKLVWERLAANWRD